MSRFFRCVLLFLFLFCQALYAQTNCILINEILVNGPGACDGGCNPNTEEWVELYNSCNVAVDISCWSLADGDFTVRIPAGTIIPAGGYLIIGSNNSPLTPDLNIATCNCTSGTPSGIGTFTNANEQVILLDQLGNIADALQWGAGQFPVNINAPASASCVAQNISFNNSSSVFEILPQSGGNGCTMARVCDGAAVWEERCNAAITGGSANGQNPIPAFTSSVQTICASACISFTDLSTGAGINAWQWFFPGASIGGSLLQNPAGLCYNLPGAYDVTLSISSQCGNFSLTIDSFITVTPRDSARIFPDSTASFCQGDSLMLVAGGAGPFQWILDGSVLPGINHDTLFATVPGNYAVVSGSGACSDTSALLSLSYEFPLQLFLSPPASSVLCAGDSVLLIAGSGPSLYSFILNNAIISTQTDSFLFVSQAGTYEVLATGSLCADTSNQIQIFSAPDVANVISATGDSLFCEGSSLLLLASGINTSAQWLLNGFPIAGANDSTFLATSAGSYSVISNPVGVCPDTSGSMALQQLPAPQPLIFSTPSSIICPGDTALLFSQQMADSLSWFFNGLPLNISDDTLKASLPGNYGLEVHYLNGCIRSSDPFVLSLHQVPINGISANPPTACEGEQVILSVDLLNAGNVLWSDGSSGSTLLIIQSGTYSCTGISPEGCSVGASLDYTFETLPIVDAGINQVNSCGSGVTLTGLVLGGEFEWLPLEETGNSKELSLQVNPAQDTYFTLLAHNGNCFNVDTVLVEVNECELFVPDAFSPNGDGNNDIFRVRGPFLSDFHLGIFDRWGRLVHELHSTEELWSGEIKGSPAESGVYHWVLYKALDLRGQPVPVRGGNKGNVSLIR